MKVISTLLFGLFFLSANSQHLKVTGNYGLGIPQKDMGKNIQPAHSLELGVLYQLPEKLKRLSVGLEVGVGSYASKRIEQTFQFDNNTTAVVPVNYNSNTFNASLQTRLNLSCDKSLVIPYINAKGGVYKLFSNVNIEDPEDPNGCHALEQKTIISDKTMFWSAGAGLQIDPGIFSKNKKRSNIKIDFSANTIHGGKMSYINTKHLIDAQTLNDPGSKPLNVEFVNASTQTIHEHTVAQVYTSPLRMLEFRAGVIFRLGN
jgi:hypothetical protein